MSCGKAKRLGAAILLSFAVSIALFGQIVPAKKPRARDLGVPFDGAPGPLNAITDVAGVEVGHVTLIPGGVFIAFSTGNAGAARTEGTISLTMLPHGRLRAVLKKYNRLAE